MTDTKKVNKHYSALINFLSNNRYNINQDKKYNLISYSNIFKGKFYIDANNSKEFINLYCDAICNNVDNLSILEIQPDYNFIIVDIDLKKPIEECNSGERLYDQNLIMLIIKKYISVIEIYLEIDKENFSIAIFEKEKATDLHDIYKDGYGRQKEADTRGPRQRHGYNQKRGRHQEAEGDGHPRGGEP